MNVWLHPRLHRSHCHSSSGQPVGGQSPVARHQNHRNEADFQRSDQESRHNAITLPDSTVRTPGRTLRVVLRALLRGWPLDEGDETSVDAEGALRDRKPPRHRLAPLLSTVRIERQATGAEGLSLRLDLADSGLRTSELQRSELVFPGGDFDDIGLDRVLDTLLREPLGVDLVVGPSTAVQELSGHEKPGRHLRARRRPICQRAER